VIPGTLLRYRSTYRDAIPDRAREIFLVIDSARCERGEQYLVVLGRGEELHFRYSSLFMYEEVEGEQEQREVR
jgi:hypothetical protein